MKLSTPVMWKNKILVVFTWTHEHVYNFHGAYSYPQILYHYTIFWTTVHISSWKGSLFFLLKSLFWGFMTSKYITNLQHSAFLVKSSGTYSKTMFSLFFIAVHKGYRSVLFGFPSAVGPPASPSLQLNATLWTKEACSYYCHGCGDQG